MLDNIMACIPVNIRLTDGDREELEQLCLHAKKPSKPDISKPLLASIAFRWTTYWDILDELIKREPTKKLDARGTLKCVADMLEKSAVRKDILTRIQDEIARGLEELSATTVTPPSEEMTVEEILSTPGPGRRT